MTYLLILFIFVLAGVAFWAGFLAGEVRQIGKHLEYVKRVDNWFKEEIAKRKEIV